MATYYAKVRLEGVSGSIPVQVEARSVADAKKLIEVRNGKVIQWSHSPVTASKPPGWFK